MNKIPYIQYGLNLKPFPGFLFLGFGASFMVDMVAYLGYIFAKLGESLAILASQRWDTLNNRQNLNGEPFHGFTEFINICETII